MKLAQGLQSPRGGEAKQRHGFSGQGRAGAGRDRQDARQPEPIAPRAKEELGGPGAARTQGPIRDPTRP